MENQHLSDNITTSDSTTTTLTIGHIGSLASTPEIVSDIIPLREFQRNIAKYLKKGGSYLVIGREGNINVTIRSE